ncbi:MAG: hypothetical protein ACM3O3_09680 [Syntrophothermus sp.]
MLKFKLLFLFITSLLLVGCSDDPSSIGSDLLSQDLIDVNVLDSQTDSLSQTSSSFLSTLQLSGSTKLFLGKTNNIDEASILIKFQYSFEDTIKTAFLNNSLTIRSAYVELIKTYSVGTGSLDYTVHKINSDWSHSTFSGDSLSSLQFDAPDISSNRRVSSNDSVYSFDVDIPSVQKWMREAADSTVTGDKGIYIQPTSNSTKIVGFQALSSTVTTIPRLYVVVEKSGSYVDTLSFISTMDVSGIKATLPQSSENIFVQGGTEIKSKLRFDLSKLPELAIVNQAELTLTLDSTASLNSVTSNIYAYFVADSSNQDSLSSTYVLLQKSGNVLSGDISYLVQRWLKEKINYGLLLVPQNNAETVDLFAIRGSNSNVYSERPHLKITYTNKK